MHAPFLPPLTKTRLHARAAQIEERDHFVRNFNQTYSKILDYERSNVEFKNMFSVSNSKAGQTRVRYQHPIKKFLEAYRAHIPVNSIFEGFPMQEKQTVTDMLVSIQGMMSKIDHCYKKVKTFQVFRGNTYLFKQGPVIDLPDVIIEKQNGFLDYLTIRDQIHIISLDHTSLSKSEQDL